MAKHTFYNYLGIHNKAYKTSIVDEQDFNKFLNNLKDYFIDLEHTDISNEVTIKGIFAEHLLKGYKIRTEEKRVDLTIINKDDYKPQVLFEFKSPINKNEMLQLYSENINRKALQQAIYYFYNQETLENLVDIKNIIITDAEHLFFFYPKSFLTEHLRNLAPKFQGQNTDVIYALIKEKIENKNIQFEYSEFDLIKYKSKILENNLSKDDLRNLKYLYKSLHPDFLLKNFIPKDSNELNSRFYDELLYILGLEEKKEKGKSKIIASTQPGTLRDNIYHNLNLPDSKKFDASIQLIIVWLNRLLFLKLFEAQLINFNSEADKNNYMFLNSEKIKTFGDLKELFFNVLGKPIYERYGDKKEYIPYLNSSLFEENDAEIDYKLKISDLTDNMKLKPFKGKGNEQPLLKYLLDFLDKYNFSSTISETENTKEIINSSVLGLVFEKLNGYKDGSFFTPGYITEYMAETAINNIIIQKYKEYKPEELCNCIKDLKELINRDNSFNTREDRRNFYNELLLNNIKICDPAVGSGHFLVSALNYIISLKSELELLTIPNKIEVQNDSLVIYENDGETQFEYKRKDIKTLEIQQTVFKEKQKIIENCLFGVDKNPNSVEICRLRLWIELLKNTYYIDNSNEMQILPNIDINIKKGDSLVSKINFSIGEKIGSRETDIDIKSDLQDYKQSVMAYKKTSNKILKQKCKEKIESIKTTIKKEIIQIHLFDTSIYSLNPKENEEQDNSIYNDSFEWAIEFPEIISDDGKFLGFDIIIGNPPYFNVQTLGAKNKIISELKKKYSDIWMDKSDILFYFIRRAYQLTKSNVYFIISNAFLFSDKAKNLRNFIVQKMPIIELINFEQYMVFGNASITSCIVSFEKSKKRKLTNIINFKEKKIPKTILQDSIYKKIGVYSKKFKENDVFSLEEQNENKINKKIDSKHKKLGDILKIGKGMETSADPIFLFKSYPHNFPDELIKKRISGENIEKYFVDSNTEYILYFEHIDKFENLPLSVQNYLINNENTLKNRADKKRKKTNKWWNYTAPIHKELYCLDKIYCSRRCAENRFCYVNGFNYLGLSNMTVIFDTNKDYNLKYILSLLNSKLLNFRYKSIGKQTGNGIFEYFPNGIAKLPIPYVNNEEQMKFVEIVDDILKLTSSNDYKFSEEKQQIVKECEIKLDNMVFKLYKLSYEDVLEIDNDFSLSKQDYINLKF